MIFSKQLSIIHALTAHWVKGKGRTFAFYPFPVAILVQATTSTNTQSSGRRVYINSIICENENKREKGLTRPFNSVYAFVLGLWLVYW